MPQSEPSKHSKIDSLAPSEQPTVSSPSNCGINLHPKCKIASTSFINHESHQPNWHMRRLKDRMTTIVTLLHPLAPGQSYTKIQTQGPLGPHMALTCGTWDRPKTTTDATFITYLKQRDAEHQDWQNYSHNTVESPRTHLSHTSENCQLNSKKPWSLLDETAGQFVSSKCWRDTSTPFSMALLPLIQNKGWMYTQNKG